MPATAAAPSLRIETLAVGHALVVRLFERTSGAASAGSR